LLIIISGSRKNPRGFLSRSTGNSDFLKIKKIHAARKMDVSADDKLGFFYMALQLISRNFGHANCEVGWEFGNYKHEIIKLIGNRPIKFESFASNYRNSL
jgi:hypothetical protein